MVKKFANKGLLLVLVSVFTVGCLILQPFSPAYAANRYITRSSDRPVCACLDSSGNQVNTITMREPRWYQDSEGRQYHCVEPFFGFTEGSFSESSASSHYSAKVISRCALATLWCDDNISDAATRGSVLQVFIWRILVEENAYGRVEDLYAGLVGRTVNWHIEGVESDTRYNAFNTWYNAHKDEYDTDGVFLYRSDSQSVARFWATKKVGYSKISKNVAF